MNTLSTILMFLFSLAGVLVWLFSALFAGPGRQASGEVLIWLSPAFLFGISLVLQYVLKDKNIKSGIVFLPLLSIFIIFSYFQVIKYKNKEYNKRHQKENEIHEKQTQETLRKEHEESQKDIRN